MSDITELAQSLKAAANTTADAIDRLKAFPGDELIDLSQHEGEQVDIDIATLNQWYELSSPANVLALVEALASEKRICATWRKTAEANSETLEKAQQRIGKLEKKITDHKRMNQEMAKAMLTPNDSDAAGMEIAALRQRIAEMDAVLEREREKSRRVMSRIAELESHKAALLKFVRDSCYVFDGTDEDISDAYVDAITSGLMPKLESVAACNPPLFWVRVKSDGGYEGPIHDSKLEDVRKNSGEWLPLTLARGVPEREPRTVTVKLPQAVSAGGQGYQEQVERILTAAGIKVEAE